MFRHLFVFNSLYDSIQEPRVPAILFFSVLFLFSNQVLHFFVNEKATSLTWNKRLFMWIGVYGLRFSFGGGNAWHNLTAIKQSGETNCHDLMNEFKILCKFLCQTNLRAVCVWALDLTRIIQIGKNERKMVSTIAFWNLQSIFLKSYYINQMILHWVWYFWKI